MNDGCYSKETLDHSKDPFFPLAFFASWREYYHTASWLWKIGSGLRAHIR